jgi:hypothetical protein
MRYNANVAELIKKICEANVIYCNIVQLIDPSAACGADFLQRNRAGNFASFRARPA